MLQAVELFVLRPAGLVLGAVCFVPVFVWFLAYFFWPRPMRYRL